VTGVIDLTPTTGSQSAFVLATPQNSGVPIDITQHDFSPDTTLDISAGTISAQQLQVPHRTSTESHNLGSVPSITDISQASGDVAGGTEVILTGSNLLDVTSVKFGPNSAASFTVVSATEVKAFSPAGVAGTVDVSVTSAVATDYLRNAFTYTGPSSDKTLSNLVLDGGTLSPLFTPETAHYMTSVAHSVSSITVTPTVNEPHATVKVNTRSITSGSPSDAISLAVGANTISVEVTAQDGQTTGTYNVVVTRAAPSSSGEGGSSVDPAPPVDPIPMPVHLQTRDDTINTWISKAINGNVASNDTFPSGAIFSLATDVGHGRLALMSDGAFSYVPMKKFKGMDSFTYNVCEAATSNCSTSTSTINVGIYKLAQHVLALSVSKWEIPPRAWVTLSARGGDVKTPPTFRVVASEGARCVIRGRRANRRLRVTGSSGASCSVTATKPGNKIFDAVTSDTVTVTLR
jgi:hypothetical protein